MPIKKFLLLILFFLFNLNLISKEKISVNYDFFKIYDLSNIDILKNSIWIVGTFFSNDEKILIANSCCGLFIYNVINNNVEYVIRDNATGTAGCNNMKDGYLNPFYLSNKYIAYLNCSDIYEKGVDIIIFNLENYKIEKIINTGLKSSSVSKDRYALYISNDNKVFISGSYASRKCLIKGWDIKDGNLLFKELISSKEIFCDTPFYADNNNIIFIEGGIIYNVKDKVIKKIIDVNIEDLLIKDNKFKLRLRAESYNVDVLNITEKGVIITMIYSLGKVLYWDSIREHIIFSLLLNKGCRAVAASSDALKLLIYCESYSTDEEYRSYIKYYLAYLNIKEAIKIYYNITK